MVVAAGAVRSAGWLSLGISRATDDGCAPAKSGGNEKFFIVSSGKIICVDRMDHADKCSGPWDLEVPFSRRPGIAQSARPDSIFHDKSSVLPRDILLTCDR